MTKVKLVDAFVYQFYKSDAEKLGECPSCGRILRVPARASAAAPGKLKIGQLLNGSAGASNGKAAAAATSRLSSAVKGGVCLSKSSSTTWMPGATAMGAASND